MLEGLTDRDTEALRFPLRSSVSPVVKNLLPRSARGDLEVDATIVIGFACGCEIEVGKENLVGTARAEVKQSIAHDGVVDHVGLMAVFENEHSRRLGGHGRFRFAGSWFNGSVSFRCEITGPSALHWRLHVSRARSSDVVGVSRVIV